MTSILLIFVKNPRLGTVKTRLARTVGDADALRIYTILLETTRQAALQVAAQRWVFYSDEIEPKDAWTTPFFQKHLQAGGGLGERMEQAFREAFAAGAQRVLIIGSDCPDLDGALLQESFDRLDGADFVLGPTPDGGYYLLGMRTFEPAVFQGIAWSTESVCTETLLRIRQAGKTCFLLPERADVDTGEDWSNAVRRQPALLHM